MNQDFGDTSIGEADRAFTEHLEKRVRELFRENEKLKGALKPSAETKAVYSGEFHFLQEAYSEEFGEEVTCRVTVPWTTIKEIMAAIRAHAGRVSDEHPKGEDAKQPRAKPASATRESGGRP